MSRLTNDVLKNATAEAGKRLELRDHDEPGLIFRVTEKGVRSWSVRYVNSAGEHRRKSIGPYPVISLSRARDEARKIKGAVAAGVDVVGNDLAHKAKEAGRKLHRVGDLADAYFADAALGLHKANARGPKRASTMTEERRIFDKVVAPALNGTAVPDIKRADIQALVSKVSRKSAGNGRQCLAVIRQLMSYAIRKEIIETNPAHDISIIAAKSRERVLSDDELKALWLAFVRPVSVAGLSLSPQMGIALKLALVTLQRGGEVVGMRWDEIDRPRKLWTIPAARMKGKRTHLVPLSDMALAILDDCDGQSEFVFASGDTHLDRRSFSRAMNRVAAALNIPAATPHDFRRTGATNLTSERIGLPRFIVSQVIGHAGDTGGAAAVTGRHYDLNDYLPEKRKALQAWAALLEEIMETNVQNSARESEVGQ